MKNFIYFIPNVYINTFLTFYFSYLLVELSLYVFRIKRPSWQYFFRLLPFLKVPVDLFLYHFNNWTVNHQIVLSSLPEKGRWLTATAGFHSPLPFYTIRFHLTDKTLGFAPFDQISEKIGYLPTFIVTATLLSYSLTRLSKWVILAIKELKNREPLLKEYPKELIDPQLFSILNKKSLGVYISERENFSPYLQFAFQRKIVLPKNIEKNLTTSEIDAVIAHEIAHANFFMLLITPYLFIVKACFFFTTTRKIQTTLEKVCDFYIIKKKLSSLSLANAIRKLATAHLKKSHIIPQFARKPTLERIQSLFTTKANLSWKYGVLYFILLAYLGAFILSGQIGHF